MRRLPVSGRPCTARTPGTAFSSDSMAEQRGSSQWAGYRTRRRPRTEWAIVRRMSSLELARSVIVAEEPVGVPERRRPRERRDRTAQELPAGPERQTDRDYDRQVETTACSTGDALVQVPERAHDRRGHREAAVRGVRTIARARHFEVGVLGDRSGDLLGGKDARVVADQEASRARRPDGAQRAVQPVDDLVEARGARPRRQPQTQASGNIVDDADRTRGIGP